MGTKGQNPYSRPDHFTREAKKRGFPARSVFKLEEIDRRVKLLRKGQRVLDMGAAPGSWALYAAEKVGLAGKVVAVDLSPLAKTPPPNVHFFEGNVLELPVETFTEHGLYDVVLSDMAPRTTGTRESDQAKSFELFMRALDVAEKVTAPKGSFVGKIFMGPDFPAAKKRLKELFETERTIKPEGTRDSSFEIFLIGMGRRA